jgi:hypothetical protein
MTAHEVSRAADTAPDPGGRPARRGLREVWRDWRAAPEDRFGVLLFFVVMTIVVSALVNVGASYGQAFAAHFMNAAALLAAMRATGTRRSRRRVVEALVLGILACFGVVALVEALAAVTLPQVGRADPVWLVVVMAVPVLVIRRLSQHTIVGGRTVLGAVAAYLQIAIAWAALYLSVDAWTTSWLFGQPETSSAYTYVSLTTISTLGIGDIVPATDLARLLLSAEAVLGQVFLVTIVAIVVARFAGDRRPEAVVRPDGAPDGRDATTGVRAPEMPASGDR